jgi:diacylglycerol kinase (ATP)
LKVFVILNGVSTKKKRFYSKILPTLKANFEVTVEETLYAGHAVQLAAVNAQNFDTIISAGGDGTLNQVLNGLLSKSFDSLPKLGIIPLGSGNDFAGAIGLGAEVDQLVSLLKENKPLLTDIGKIVCHDSSSKEITKYFINVASTGMGPATVLQMEKMPRWLGTNLRYLAAILHTFFMHKATDLNIETDQWSWHGKARVWAMANGRSFGNKIFIAPFSKVDDGVLDAFLASNVPALKFLVYLQQLKSKKKVLDSKIQYHRGAVFTIQSSEQTAIEAEGEIQGYLPARIEILAKRISIFR